MSELAESAPATSLPGDLTDLERQLPAIFDSVADGVTVIDRSGTVRFANEAAARLMGRPTGADVIGRASSELIGSFEMLDEDGQPFDPAGLPTRRAFAGEDNFDAVIRFRVSGSLQDRWSLVRARLLRGPAPENDLVVTSFQDISALKQTELRLSFLSETSAILGESVAYHESLTRVAKRAVPFIADWCAIDVIEPSNEVHRVALAQADPQMQDIADEAQRLWTPDAEHPGAVGQLLPSGRTMHVVGVTDEMLQGAARDSHHLQTLRKLGISEVLIVPLIGRGKILGALTAVNTGDRPLMIAEDVVMIEELGRRAGAAVDAARLMFDAQEAVHLRDEFMAIVSHDMRTPLPPCAAMHSSHVATSPMAPPMGLHSTAGYGISTSQPHV